jgi:hypothetical protein
MKVYEKPVLEVTKLLINENLANEEDIATTTYNLFGDFS